MNKKRWDWHTEFVCILIIVNSCIHWFNDDWHVTAIHLHNIDKRPHSSYEYYIHFFRNDCIYICIYIYESMKRAKWMNEWIRYICICLYLYKQHFNWWRWHQRKSEKCSHSLSSRTYMCVTSLFPPPYLQKKTSRPETRETKNRLCVHMYVRMYVCMSVTYRHSIYTRSTY